MGSFAGNYTHHFRFSERPGLPKLNSDSESDAVTVTVTVAVRRLRSSVIQAA